MVRQVLVIAIAIMAAYWDIKHRKIPNHLVIPATVLGLILNVWVKGWPGLLESLGGICVGILLLLIPFALGGLGAGDVKLLGAFGAVLGPGLVFRSGLYGAVAGGVMALAILLVAGRLVRVVRNLVWSFASLFVPGVRPISPLSMGGEPDRAGLDCADTQCSREPVYVLPYGVAISLGAVIAVLTAGT